MKSFTVILALLIAAPALADTTVGKQTYMVTARESQVLSILKQQAPGTFGAAGAGVLTMNSVVSFTASADDQIVIYDHWEDGFETDAYAAPSLLKATTLRFRLFKGQTISLTSTTNNQVVPCTPAGGMTQTAVPVAAAASCNFTDDPLHTGTDAQTVPLVATTQACSYACSNILTSPRGVAVRFDGGDRISTIGGGISLIHEVYPQIANSERWATSLEHFSKESLRGFLSFRLPIGQTGADPFRFARAFVTAFEDNTTITLDNGTKNVTVTLNSGQSFSTAGTAAIVGTRDETNLTLAESLLLVAGTRLDADKEVAVAMTNVSTAANPAIDLEAVLPVRAYGRDFVLPHGAPLAGMTHRLYLFNPNETAATVTVFNRNAVPTTINIPANSQGTHDLLAQNWAVSAPNYPIATRLRSDVPIWGIGIHDLSFNSDYSYALVPTRILTNEYVIPYTPTAAGAANNGNAIFIAPTEDLTKVEIYYPGSATPSIVDIDGSGTVVAASDCPASYACNSLAPSYTLRTRSGGNDPYLATQRNSAMKFFGGGTFANLAGTRIVASAPIVVTYQQDADVPGGTGSTFDMGFSIIPPSALLLESLLDASVAATPATLPLGATPNITLNMSAASGSEGPVSALVFRATLDADFLSVGGPWPATVTKPGGGTYVVNAVEETSGPVPPAGMRRFRVTLDTTGPNATQLQPFQTVNVALTLTPAAAPTIDDSETISIDVDAIFGGQPLSPTAQTTLLRSPFTVTKTAPASVITGQQFTYVFQVTNTGGSDINNVVLHDVLPEGLTFVAGSGTGAACTLNAGPGEVDCTLAPATVTAGQVRNVTFDVIAGALPGGAVITNRARVESGSNANLAWSNEATTTITAPVWTVTTTPALSASMNQNTQITFTACAQTTVATTNVILSAPIPTTVPGLSYVNNSFRSSTNGVFTGFGNPATPATQAFASVGANIPICIEFKMLMANTAPDNSLYSMVGTVVSTQSPERQTSPALTIVCTVANNGPTNTVPGLQTTNEDVPLMFSSANVNRIQTSDPDSGPNPLLVTLSVTRGTLTLGATTGLTFSVGDGTTDTTMTFTGTVANVNNAIATITFIPTLNLASPPNAVLTLNVNDQGNTGTGGAASDNDTVNITVNAVDDPPLFTSSNAVSVPENQTAVTTATATDAEGNALTFSLNGGADAALFSITSGGVLTFLTAKDFENPTDSGADNVYDVIVRATSNGLSTDLPMAVTVTNVNEPPVFTSSATVNVAENQTAVTTATASDPENDARTFSLNGGADASFFSITSGGVLTFQSARDFEAPADAGANNVYNVIVRATANGQTTDQAMAITVTNVDEPPVFTSSATVNVAENQTAITTVSASDPENDARTFTLNGGADAAQFSITSGGVLTFIATKDFESPADAGANNVYNVIVRATANGQTTDQAMAITVTNVDEPPVFTSSATVNVAENQTAVTTVTASDPENDARTFTLNGGPDAAQFSITAGGVLTFLVAENFESPADAGADNVYNVIVRATANGQTTDLPMAITVTNVDEPPVITSSNSANVTEGNTAALTVTSTDPEGDARTYSIIGGPDAVRFAIDPVTGALTFLVAPVFATPTDAGGNNVYDVTVQALANGQTATQAIAVTVTSGVNDPPLILAPGMQSTSEDVSLVFSSGGGNQISISDSDAGSAALRVTLTAVGGTATLVGITNLSFFAGGGTADAMMIFEGDLLAINAAIATLTFTPASNYFGAASLQVLVDDLGNSGSGGAQSASATIDISVLSQNDAPQNTLPAPPSTNEDVPLTITSLSIADPDAGSAILQLTLAIDTGTLTLVSTTDLTFNAGANGSATMTVSGTLAALNAALTAGVTFTPALNVTSNATLTMTSEDLGNSGAGATGVDNDTLLINVLAQNDAPTIALPGAQATPMNTALTLDNALAITVSDVDATTLEVTLTAANGLLTLADLTGLAITTGTGTADASVTFSGLTTDVLAALDGLVFAPTNGFSGPTTIAVLVSDLGATGAGGTRTANASLDVTVQDSTPPDTQIDSGPGGTIAVRTATFTFSSSDPTVTAYECSLDGAAFAACTGPMSYSGLSDGAHTFSVRAKDPSGNVDPTPATRSFSVAEDTDGDGVPDADEIPAGTDPNDADSDDDGVKDGDEPMWNQDSDGDGLINALDVDSDNDGLFDGTELGLTMPHADTDIGRGFFVPDADAGATKTDPLDKDTDDGGVRDGAEDTNHNGKIDPGEIDPNVGADDQSGGPDRDGDGVPDEEEERFGLDPDDADTDDDGIKDGDEPNGFSDTDGDGLINARDPDSDNDRLMDGTERGVTSGVPDPDGAGPMKGTDTTSPHFVPDGDAGATKTNMLIRDTDRGGVRDGVEDTDHDGVVDQGEREPVATPSDDPGAPDKDGDGIPDDDEEKAGTDPNDKDTDDDGVADGDEPNWNEDFDGDGLINARDPDSDDDGILDGTELGKTTPTADTDTSQGFFIPDADPTTRTNPLDKDTDDGGVDDGAEDTNKNGRVDPGEIDPRNAADDSTPRPDGDGDGLTDDEEILYGTDPNDADTDNDGVKDGDERNWNEDTDHDGRINAKDEDSDSDGLFDGTEMGVTTPDKDTDVSQGFFVPDADPSTTTSPLDPDTDRGGVKDGDEDADRNGRVDPGERDPLFHDDDDDAFGMGQGRGFTNCVGFNDNDLDGDGLGDACDPDIDNDGVLNNIYVSGGGGCHASGDPWALFVLLGLAMTRIRLRRRL